MFELLILFIKKYVLKVVKCDNDHYLKLSDRSVAGQSVWKCNKCKTSETGNRWFCFSCNYNLCFDCLPEFNRCARGHCGDWRDIQSGEFTQYCSLEDSKQGAICTHIEQVIQKRYTSYYCIRILTASANISTDYYF